MNLEYPRLTGKELLQFLQEIGVEVVCQRGNHVIVKNGKKKVRLDYMNFIGELRKNQLMIMRKVYIIPTNYSHQNSKMVFSL